MTLSISKLEKLLSAKGYIPYRYLTIDDYCTYIHVVSTVDNVNFLLYIPSKYEFKMKPGKNIFSLKDIDLTGSKTTAEEYARYPDRNKIEDEYTEIDLDIAPNKDKNIAEHLEEGYKREISLNDISKEDTTDIKDIYRQLKRLGYCVQNIKYKLGIMYKNYLCVIRRDDSLECFFIKKWRKKDTRQLFTIVDLETLYDQFETVQNNVKTVLKGVYKVLNKNQYNHRKTLKKFLDEKTDIILSTKIAQDKTVEYTKYIAELEEMLNIIFQSEKKILIELHTIREQSNNATLRGLQNDIEKSHAIGKKEEELNNLKHIKKDILNNIEEIKSKRDDTLLNVDKVLFDNQVMLYEIIKNFEYLGKITNK